MSTIDTSLAQPWNPERTPTHRCKVCGALWVLYPGQPTASDPLAQRSGSWSLASKQCGKCCDNVAMGDQIEALPDPLTKPYAMAMSAILDAPDEVMTAQTIEIVDAPRPDDDSFTVEQALAYLSLDQRSEILLGCCNGPLAQNDQCLCASDSRALFMQLGIVRNDPDHGSYCLTTFGKQVREQIARSIALVAADATAKERFEAVKDLPDHLDPEGFVAAFQEATESPTLGTRTMLTFGQRTVRFRDDDTKEMSEVKARFADILDILDSARAGYAPFGGGSQRGRLLSVAITEAEGACMWAVKGLTEQ